MDGRGLDLERAVLNGRLKACRMVGFLGGGNIL